MYEEPGPVAQPGNQSARKKKQTGLLPLREGEDMPEKTTRSGKKY